MTVPRIELVPVAKLVPYERNSRTHSDEQVAQIAASIGEFGWTNPVLIDDANGIIAGAGRVMAAKLRGLEAVPCIRLDHLSEAQRRALIIADNKLALNAGWDNALLALELGDLQGLGFDLALTGFGEIELGALFASSTVGLTDPDEVPDAPAVPVTQPGDLWCLGRHRLVCGDSGIRDDVEKVRASAQMDMIVTDPPYCSGGRQDGGRRNSTSIGTRDNTRIARDNLTTKGYLALMGRVLSNADVETVYVFTDWRMWTWTYDALEGSGYPVRNMLVWDKNRMGMGFPWRSQHELVAFAKRGAASMLDGKAGNVLRCDRSPNELHPTQKPAELIERLIANTTGDVVFDPFCGSGTTIIAAEMTGRVCHAIEIEPAYCDVAVERWQNFTGGKAERVARAVAA